MVRGIALGLLVLPASVAAAEDTPAPPNVLIIYVDDLGYGDVGAYGHPVIETPALDRLAEEGLRLTRYYAPSPLCSPSRAGLLTGRHPYRAGIRSWIPEGAGIFLGKDEVTLATVLHEAGYVTALVGKWHLNSDLGKAAEPQPLDHGFDYHYGHNAFQIPTNRNPTNLFRNGEALPAQEGYTAQLYADDALRWLGEVPATRPWFLMLSMAEPHTTIENPPEWNARYSQFTDGPVVPIPSGGPIPVDRLTPRGPGEYYANVAYMDHHIGRVIEALREAGQLDNTVVVFASDNGPVTEDWRNWWEVNAYGSTGGYRGRKHLLYEGGIRVPAIVRYPAQIEAGSVSDALVTGLDWMPTILRLLDLQAPAELSFDGMDVSKVLAGGDTPERPLLWALPDQDEIEYAYRRGPWKLLLGASGTPRALFNLETDPLEFFDQLQQAPARVATLREEFEILRADIEGSPAR